MDDELTDAEVNQLLRANLDEGADYYTLLGLPRDPPPSTAQIRSAYHKCSLAFHPDKQPSHFKDVAEEHFTRIRRAYETLIEPRKRVIYDLEGEEGVQNEYGQGGAMGPGGESEKQLSPVKVMTPKEFKRWFIGVMRGRERRAFDALVQNQTALDIGLDATSNFVDEAKVISDGKNEYIVPCDKLQLQRIGVNSSFTLPMPALGRLLERQIRSPKQIWQDRESHTADDEEVDSGDSWADALGPSVPELTLSGGISGEIQEAIVLLETNLPKKDAEAPFYDRIYNMATTQQIELGAKIGHTFPEQIESTANNSIASRLQGVDVELEASLLPHPAAITLGLGKVISFASDVRPFFFYTRTTFKDSPLERPPELQVTVTRALGVQGNCHCYLLWQSGEQQWRPFFSRFISRIHSPTLSYMARWLSTGQASPVMKLGTIWAPPRFPKSDESIDEDPSESLSQEGAAAFITNAALVAYAGQVQLEISHSFDLFTRFNEPPVRSRITNSGEAVSPPTPTLGKSRGLRVELAASAGLPASLDLSMTGKRRVGTFSMLGLGVGINQALGLHCSLSWSRLGQSIRLPIALVPLDDTTTTALLCAIGAPWALYAVVEFLVVRPAQNRRRKRIIKSQRAKLRGAVAARREEAAQALALMQPSVAHRQAIEHDEGGLVILSARYGVRGAKPGSWKDGAVADVGVALASLVDRGQLILARGLDKSRLMGFWDPSPLERKTLEVEYLFGGRKHRVDVRGGQGLTLPKREHEVEEAEQE